MSDLHQPAPGATPFDADGLIDPDIQTKQDLDEAEASGILIARRKHLRATRKKGWFTAPFLQRVHGDMFRGIWSWAGDYRGRDFVPNIGVAFHQVPIELEKLCQDVAFWAAQTEKTMAILEQAVRIHHRLVAIHPFRNGNGRHARLMSDIFLSSQKHPMPQWPYQDMMDDGSPRSVYIQALQAADRGDYGPLLGYTKAYLPAGTT